MVVFCTKIFEKCCIQNLFHSFVFPICFSNIVSLLFFLMWPNHHHFSFSNFFILMDIFFLLVNHLSNKSANIMSTVGERVTLVQSFGIKIFAHLGLKGVTKDHILCFMIKKHGHTSFPKHDYFLFQEILTQERIWFMLQFVPCSYSCLSFFKPPFQVFSLADIFYLLFSC